MKSNNRKRVLTVLLTALLVIGAVVIGHVMTFAETEGLFTYTVFDGNATVTKCDTAAAGEVTIPAALGGHPVTEIAANAFSGCANITILSVPSSVETIGLGAFQGCSALTEITLPFVGANASGTGNCHFGYIFDVPTYNHYYGLPSTLKKVTVTGGFQLGENAFAECQYLTSVTLPDTLTAIGSYAFSYCSALKSLTIPSSVLSIG
ncbi:MAG: leucine-rich repeat domain-containing protein, partial [Clostridia bacterium]|nr:leucine-rich repeat domain-containing protein [Clostridia bacterium]